MIIPVILSGGAGTRLWPLSRELYPKQLHALAGERTMLQETLARLDGIPGLGEPMVVCNEEHRFLVAEQLRQLGIEGGSIILEPCGRNTAPAAAVAALQAASDGDDPVLLLLPADHLIQDVAAFQQAVAAALPLAEEGRLVTFGIVPSRAETGYGYIRAGESLECSPELSGAKSEDVTPHSSPLTPYRVAAFVEKPDLATAESYLASGDYYWNSGMFLFRASSFNDELKRHRGDIFEACVKAQSSLQSDLDFLRLDRELFAACPSDSIDYAVMEKTDDAAVLPLDAGWNDVGSWQALWEVGDKNTDANVVQCDAVLEDVSGCYLRSEKRLVAGVGLKDLVVVDTRDAVLVADRARVQDVKKLVEQLKEAGRDEVSLHKLVNRPWGSYESLNRGERFQVKRITVKPASSSSLQVHHHRSEHWVVVRGTAEVTCGEEVRLVSENESIYIPVGTAHRIANPGKLPLDLIEVQTGSYLGEDDIVRIDDEYGREKR